MFESKRRLWLVLVLAFGLVLTTGCGLFTDDEVVEEEEKLSLADFFNDVTNAFEKTFQSFIDAVEGWDDFEWEWALDEDKEVDFDNLWAYFDHDGFMEKEDLEEYLIPRMNSVLNGYYNRWTNDTGEDRDAFLEENIELDVRYKYFEEIPFYGPREKEDYPQEGLRIFFLIAKETTTVGEKEYDDLLLFEVILVEYPEEFKLVDFWLGQP